ncbi:hypothetical protein PG993_005226 [Apiospora rasikravindrae]|uniref:FXSXX-COOH protein n=1 Tax=Apiospora rasikravindrae TaxID=990691 RepID=A0ABR1TFM2_9PEZI
MGGVKTLQAIGQKSSRGIDQLRDDDTSITRLATTPSIRSKSLRYTAGVVLENAESSDDDTSDGGKDVLTTNIQRG